MSRDIRELGIFRGNGEWERMSARIEREAEEARQRQLAHERLYLRQFRRPKDQAPFPRQNLRWFICVRKGIHPDSDYEPRPAFRGIKHSHAYRDVVLGPNESEPIFKTVVPKTKTPSVDPTYYIDGDLLEGFYDSDEVSSKDPIWDLWTDDPYNRMWASVGLILNDEDFKHVSYRIVL